MNFPIPSTFRYEFDYHVMGQGVEGWHGRKKVWKKGKKYTFTRQNWLPIPHMVGSK
jgi:hypothetical protein